MKRTHIYFGISAFLVAAIVGAYTYFSFLLPYHIYQSAEQATQMYMKALQNRESVPLRANAFLYGKVLEVQPSESYIVVDIEDPYEHEAHVRMRVNVMPGAFVAKQNLLQDTSGVYAALSTKAPAALSDMRPGDRVAFSLNTSNGQNSSYYLLFGNPL